MGWKALKEHFDIKHIVQVTSKGVCIGSGYVHDLIVINPKTGEVLDNPTFGLLREKYPALATASRDEILRLLNAEDAFSSSIRVFTYHGDEIIEKRCEALGWPNVTHDGCLMYENAFSPDRAVVIGWAKQDALLGVKYSKEAISNVRRDLLRYETELSKCEAMVAKLDSEYPSS